MEKHALIGYFLQSMIFALISVDKIYTEEIKATVSWSSGKTTAFSGKADYEDDKGTAQFFGIRYGQPPVGEKRFQKAALYEYGDGNTDATKHGNVCPQRRKGNGLISDSDAMGEDCLFLNIIVPLDAAPKGVLNDVNKNKKAVYIFFHGGVFTRGSSNLYVTSHLVMHGDFIAVTLNYRLGIFGFLTTDDDVIPENLGLWDQQLAIQWVKKNIEAFGGDGSRITVGGQSAGSMSAVLQSFYSGNKDLFQNTIAESGSPFAAKVIVEKGLPSAVEVAKMAGCDLASNEGDKLSKEILKCLKGKSEADLAALRDPTTSLSPTLDNDFITRETFELCPQGLSTFTFPKSVSSNFANKNLLIGFTSDDGEILVALVLEKFMDIFKIHNRAEFLKKPLTLGLLRVMLKNYLLANKKEDALTKRMLLDAILEHYTDWSKASDTIATSMNAVKIMTDYFFVYPGIKTALLHSQANKSSTYLYEFRYPSSSYLAVNGDFPWFRGTRHGAELFLFADYGVKDSLPELTNTLYTTWSNFINTGNPNSDNSDDWKEFSKESPDMYLLTKESKIVQGTHSNTVHFWQEYLPKLQDNARAALGKKTKSVANCAPQNANNGVQPTATSPRTESTTKDNGAVGTNMGKHIALVIVSVIMASLKL